MSAKAALVIAREGIVLLKNDGLLPLRKDRRTIAVIGPNAAPSAERPLRR